MRAGEERTREEEDMMRGNDEERTSAGEPDKQWGNHGSAENQ